METPIGPPQITHLPTSGIIHDYVELEKDNAEVSPEAHFASVLSLLSSCVGWRAWTKWTRNSEPCNVWVIIDGQSARGKKSTATHSAYQLGIEAASAFEANTIYQPLLLDRKSHGSDIGLLKEIAPDETQKKDWDASIPPGNFWEWDEIGTLFGVGKGASYLVNVRKFLMSLNSGRAGSSNTLGNPIDEARVSVSVLGNMTRYELEAKFDMSLMNDGFISRFLLVPSTYTGKLHPRPPDVDPMYELKQKRISAWFSALLALKRDETLGDIYKRLTSAAIPIWDEWYIERHHSLGDYAEYTKDPVDIAMYNIMGRYQILAIRTAMTLAVSDWSPGTPLNDVQIEPKHVEAAIALVNFSMAEIYDIATKGGATRTDPKSLFKQSVIRRVTEKGPQTFRRIKDNLSLRGLDERDAKDAIWSLHPETLYCEQLKNDGLRISPPRPDLPDLPD